MITIEAPNLKTLFRIGILYLFTSLSIWYICHWYISLNNEINDHLGFLKLQPDQRAWLMGFTTIYYITCAYTFILQKGMFFTWIGLIFSNIYTAKFIDAYFYYAKPPMVDTPTEFITTGMVISVVSGLIVFSSMLLCDNLANYILDRTYLRNKADKICFFILGFF